MSAITAKASRKMKKYAVLTREPRCFLGSFDFSWEQRKVGEVSESYSGGTPSVGVKEYYGGQIPFIRSAEINSEITELFLTEEGLKNSSARLVAVGDILYALYGATSGEVGRARLKGAINQAILAIKPHTDYDSEYLAQWLRKSKHSIIETYLQGGQGNLSGTIVKELSVDFPSLKEQKAIGDFFRQLDNLITLHQRKCALLFSPFQAFISMMFTTSTFSWEQRKFEEIAVRSSVICSDDTLPRVEYEDIVSGTGRLNKDIYAKQSSKSGIVFHQGDVLYGKLRPYLQNWLLPTFDGLAVGDFWVLQPQNADSSFLYRLIQSRQFDEVANQSTGTKMPRADWKLVSKTVFSIPSNISEQAAIGTYFTALDSLITLHQRKCISFTGRAGRLISTVNKKRITSSWEQRKFSELVQIERGGSPRPIDDFITDAPNGLNWIKIGDAPTQGNYITKTAEKIRPEGLSKTREVHPGDLILSNSMSFGKPYIMGIDGCIHDGWLLIRNTYGVFDLTFLCHLLGTPQMLSQYRSLAAGSTVNNLNKELVGNTVVTIPSITEQRVLGDYLEQLDNLITLHQRKPFLMKWRTSDANRNQTNRLVL